MFKIENKSISLASVKTRNRLLDNYLDWIIYSILPTTIGNTLFPKFIEYGLAYLPMERAYLHFDTPQVITDTSTIMTYLEKSDALAISDITETIGDKSKLLSINYPFDLSLVGAGHSFEGLGFGREDDSDVIDPKVEDFLLAYVDLGVTGLSTVAGYGYGVIRVDQITTNETSISGGYDYLPGLRYGQLVSISMCFDSDGADPSKEYLMEDLTCSYVSAGNVSVTGFDDFYIEDSVLYPKTTLYPSTTLYPTQIGEKVKSVKFKYAKIDDPLILYETYINIEDLGIAYDETTISINLVCERGSY